MGRFLDRFRRKKETTVEPVDYDMVDTPNQKTDTWRERWSKKQAVRRQYVIDRKHAQAKIATHRKWVFMWVAVIVVALVILVLTIMNKFSLTGLVF